MDFRDSSGLVSKENLDGPKISSTHDLRQHVGPCGRPPPLAVSGSFAVTDIDLRRATRYALLSKFRWRWTVRIRERLSSVTIAVLLTAGLVSWPRAAGAAGQSDPDTKKGIRIEREAALQMERTEAKLSPLVLRLFGGFSQAEAGDVNEGLDGYFEIFKLYSALGEGTTTGSYNPLRAGYNFGADLIFQITRHIGIGIGAGYMRFSKSSQMTFSHGSEDIKLSGTPTLSAVPLRLGLFLTLPLGSRLNFTLDAGAAVYAALKLDAKQRLNYPYGYWLETSLSASRSAPQFDNLGFHGSLGFEFMVSPKFGFFVEALGRYARLKNFETATALNRNSYGDSETIEGRIYLETNTFDEGGWSLFTVERTPPVSVPPNIVYREPKIDLSGFSLQAGFRIRL